MILLELPLTALLALNSMVRNIEIRTDDVIVISPRLHPKWNVSILPTFDIEESKDMTMAYVITGISKCNKIGTIPLDTKVTKVLKESNQIGIP